MQKQRVLVIALMAVAFAAGITAQEAPYDVPFVPTPEEVVNAMLKLVNVGKDDVLYDLGCGDGRIVINAVKKFGARGIGIDIDPRRIEESKANAAKAEVSDRIQFKQENLFETDFGDATVLTLYLLSSVNLRLRPTILSKLKPGTRVVSHDFSMGEWEPDQSVELETNGNHHNVYFWIVPANAYGVWEWTMPDVPNGGKCSLKVEQHFQKGEGTLTIGDEKIPVKDIDIKGNLVQFTALYRNNNGEKILVKYSGNVLGNSFECTAKPENGRSINFRAERDQSTVQTLDSGESNSR